MSEAPTAVQQEELLIQREVESSEDYQIRILNHFKNKFELWKLIELEQLSTKQHEEIAQSVKSYMDKLEAERKPPSKEELELLLNQEYLEFKVKVVDRGTRKEKFFTVCELPGAVEEKFYKRFVQTVQDHATDVAALAQEVEGEDKFAKIMSFLKTFEGSFDLLADTVALVLNPDGSDAEVTPDWVKNHFSSNRMWNIVEAQIQVNRLRDFFSRLFQAGMRSSTMITPVDSQRLQLLLAK